MRDGRGGGGRVAAGGGVGLLLFVVAALIFGVDPSTVFQMMEGGGGAGPGAAAPPPADDTAAAVVEVVLGSTEDVWGALYRKAGETYPPPSLFLFSDAVRSACGLAGSAVGPFYCPADRQIYLDLSFFRELERRFGAPGDFARAYVIAHEVGHHVQNVQGRLDRVGAAQRGASKEAANALQVRVELQADCYAGVWAHHAERQTGFLEPGDIEEALGAAAAIGDDALQRQAQGYVVPESFTHGSSEQRVEWFRRGFEAGRPEACETG